MALLISVLAAFVPAFVMAAFVYWLDRYEKEPLVLLGAAFAWGAVVAAGGAFLINSILGVGIYFLTGSVSAAEHGTAALVAPFVEEALKGAALLLIFLVFHSEFDSILDGVIYAGIVALGFAATENVLYIYDRGYVAGGWAGLWAVVVIRDVVVAWQHPFFTAFTGIGVGIARINKNSLVKLLAIPTGYAFAVSSHAFHNAFSELVGGLQGFAIGSILDWLGWSVMGMFILWMVIRERGLLVRQLKDEIAGGTISAAQYSRALSPLTNSLALVTEGQAAARFYRLCGELAHKKEQLARLGDERGNGAMIDSLRNQLAALKPSVR
jgi:RsiW-degrading membrane proteinase PrsW (M82 family)